MMLLDSYNPILSNKKEVGLCPSELYPLCCEVHGSYLAQSLLLGYALQQLTPKSTHLIRIEEMRGKKKQLDKQVSKESNPSPP